MLSTMHWCTALLLVSMTTLVCSQMGDDWVITLDEEFQNVTFNCTDTPQEIPPEFWPELWMFPDLTNVDANYSDGRISVLNDGHVLDIRNASRIDFGLYHCMMLNETGDWYLVKFGLNVRGPYFEDTWELYEQGTIVGLSACFGFLAAAFLIWVVVANQWIAPENWYEEEDKDTRESQGHTNLGYQREQPPEGASGYVAVQDNIYSRSPAQQVKHRKEQNMANGKPNAASSRVGDVEMANTGTDHKGTGHDMITEL